jgi:hypothetical protein
MHGVVLYAEDIAHKMGISVGRARRLLRMMRRKHGDTVVGEMPCRRGTRLWTTPAAWCLVQPSLRKEGGTVFDRVFRLEEEVAMLKELVRR